MSYPAKIIVKGEITPDWTGVWEYHESYGGKENVYINTEIEGGYIYFYSTHSWYMEATGILWSNTNFDPFDPTGTYEPARGTTGTATVEAYNETITGDKDMATWSAKKVVIPPTTDGMETNLVVVLSNYYTGDLVNAATGACSSSVTWSDAAIVEAAAAADGKWVSHPKSNDAVVAIPALQKNRTYLFRAFDSASPAKTDTPTRIGIYDPETGRVYDDTAPTTRKDSVKI